MKKSKQKFNSVKYNNPIEENEKEVPKVQNVLKTEKIKPLFQNEEISDTDNTEKMVPLDREHMRNFRAEVHSELMKKWIKRGDS